MTRRQRNAQRNRKIYVFAWTVNVLCLIGFGYITGYAMGAGLL